MSSLIRVSRLAEGIVERGEGFGPAVDLFPGGMVGEPAIEEPGSVFEQAEQASTRDRSPHVSRRDSHRSRSSNAQLYQGPR